MIEVRHYPYKELDFAGFLAAIRRLCLNINGNRIVTEERIVRRINSAVEGLGEVARRVMTWLSKRKGGLRVIA